MGCGLKFTQKFSASSCFAVLCAGITLGSCGLIPASVSNQATRSFSTPAITPLKLVDFQPADVVLGQADFTGRSCNRNGSPAANTLCSIFGNPKFLEGIFYVPDRVNHRILGFVGIPSINGSSADFVIGQSGFTASASGNGAAQLNFVDDLSYYESRLFAADNFNGRVLGWNFLPTSNVPADLVLGQAGFGMIPVYSCDSFTYSARSSQYIVRNRLLVVNTEFNRVLIWNNVPTTSRTAPDLVLGQPDFTTCTSGSGRLKMNSPQGVWSDGVRLFIADSVNNRVLVWNNFPTANQTPPDFAIGQTNFSTNSSGTTAKTFSSPFGVISNGTQLFVADSGNNRILIWQNIPTNFGASADLVLGQGDFIHNTRNDDNQNGSEDSAATARTLGFPVGMYVDSKRLVVGDVSNNRLLIFNGK